MAVKKSVLEQMSNNELEKYIKPETTFVPEATKIAFEILKTRGRQFSPEEIDSINLLINKKEEKKIRPIHENHIKSSNFIFISVALGLINLLLSIQYGSTKSEVFSAIPSFIFVATLGYLIREGRNVKILLSVLFSIGLIFSITSVISDLIYFPLIGILSLCQTILQLLAVIFLFMIPKEFESIKNNEFELWLSDKNEADTQK